MSSLASLCQFSFVVFVVKSNLLKKYTQLGFASVLPTDPDNFLQEIKQSAKKKGN